MNVLSPIPHADLNRLVRFAERRNLVSAHVPSHLKRLLQTSVATRRNILKDLIFINSAARISDITQRTNVRWGSYSVGDSIVHRRIEVFCKRMSWVRDPRQLLWGPDRGYVGDSQTMRRDAPKFHGIFQNIFSFNLCLLLFQTTINP